MRRRCWPVCVARRRWVRGWRIGRGWRAGAGVAGGRADRGSARGSPVWSAGDRLGRTAVACGAAIRGIKGRGLGPRDGGPVGLPEVGPAALFAGGKSEESRLKMIFAEAVDSDEPGAILRALPGKSLFRDAVVD